MFAYILIGLLWVADAIAEVAIAVVTAIAAVWAIVAPIFLAIWNTLSVVWRDVLSPFWSTLQTWAKKALEWFNVWAKRVETWIKAIHEVEDKIYSTFFRPLLDTISRIRQFLELTHLEHTALGKAFEDFLGLVYADINNIWQSLSQPVNQIINTIERDILTVQNTIRSVLLLNSLFENIAGIWRMWWNAGIRQLDPDVRKILRDAAQTHTIRTSHNDLRSLLIDKGGPWVEPVADSLKTLELALNLEEPRDLGPLVPPGVTS